MQDEEALVVIVLGACSGHLAFFHQPAKRPSFYDLNQEQQGIQNRQPAQSAGPHCQNDWLIIDHSGRSIIRQTMPPLLRDNRAGWTSVIWRRPATCSIGPAFT